MEAKQHSGNHELALQEPPRPPESLYVRMNYVFMSYNFRLMPNASALAHDL